MTKTFFFRSTKIFGTKFSNISNIFDFSENFLILRNFQNFQAKNFHRSKNIYQKTFFTFCFYFRKIHECSFPTSYWTPPNSFWSRRTSNLNSQIPKSAVYLPPDPILLRSQGHSAVSRWLPTNGFWMDFELVEVVLGAIERCALQEASGI